MTCGTSWSGVHSDTAGLLCHFEASRRPEVAALFVLTITCWGPPVCSMPSQMVARVVQNGPTDIVDIVRAYPDEAKKAAGYWLLWWESQTPAGRGV